MFGAGASTHADLTTAVRLATAHASTSLELANVTASIAFLYIQSGSEQNAANKMRRVVDVARRTLGSRRVLSPSTCFIGCTSGEFPTEPGTASSVASISLLHLPDGAKVMPFRIRDDDALGMDGPQRTWWDLVGLSAPDTGENQRAPQFILFQHPDYEMPLDLLAGLDFGFPASAKVGAVAGTINPLHMAYVFDGDGAHSEGVVGMAISSPDLRMNVLLAQGARGVGPMMEVTEVKDGTEVTRAKEIGTPTEAEGAPMQLIDMWDHVDVISQKDKELARKYLLLGLEVGTLAEALASANEKDSGVKNAAASVPDMVVRKVVGFNEMTRSLAVEGSPVRIGSRAQFQVRDEESARDELAVLFDRQGLEGVTNAMSDFQLIGGFVMADSERGANLYGDVACDTDGRLFKERFKVPIASLACTGQMGPLPAPGFERHFPICGVGFAASTFTHSSAALYILLYARFSSLPEGESSEAQEEKT